MPRPFARSVDLAILLLLAAGEVLRPADAGPRGGGGFGGFREGGMGPGGCHSDGAGCDGRGSVADWQRGYQGHHPHDGPDSRPPWRDGDDWTPETWKAKRKNHLNDTTVQPTVNVNNNFYNQNVNGWNANWARGGYWANRPWNAGWYAWTPATWGWWGWNSAAQAQLLNAVCQVAYGKGS
ncbi:MAG: hypothetical protein VKP63_11365 [Cyanobacteriota bacterium]|nr:hypothetical protein [Cyanobacteriota bacterium]